MMAAEDTALLLLAAGQSRRFEGEASKLDAPFGDLPLGVHVARTLGPVPFRVRLAVVRSAAIDYSPLGFEIIENRDPVGDMASSIRLGVQRAKEHAASAVLIALADMPRVTASHVRALLEAADGSDAIVASTDGETAPRPPAVFGRRMFEQLLSLSGDQGARNLIRAGRHVITASSDLIDIDTRADLAAVQQRSHNDGAEHSR